jgi:hypothetical protein
VTATTTAPSAAPRPAPVPAPGVLHRPGTDCSECGAPVRRRDRTECDPCYRFLAGVEDERRQEMRCQGGPYTPRRTATHHDTHYQED